MELTLPQIWLIVGLVMLVAELASVLLVFVFFAIGALLTSLLAALGLLPSFESQILAFSAISLVSLIALRKHARSLMEKKEAPGYREFVGETALVIKDIPNNGEGKIYYRGAEWKAVSVHHTPIIAGSKVVITRTDGIVLIVEES
ncbi:NfeD family protein [Dyadobacter sandarakinus]|uniref:NfeD family protein n=1 Tax=Dyadobacter sandarakinus TaxID=2747268 RepID=A0ABX7IAK6_9BACT|nr:NfeD family protein [Dyadobacter sandarakinus]QRR01986.1 NfeD family protein [Dyadobacter sandarakinus]